jgi:glyoxylase-like metal-dependent hydrolase (beta-lactamase superfamily II)
MLARSLTAAIIMSSLSSAALAQERDAFKPIVYEAYAVRYATLAGYPVASLVEGADKGRKLDIAMTVWVLRGDGRTILVDSGFYRPKLLKEWKGIVDFTRPDKVVERLGIKPEHVTDAIITHTHWDHADGADLFPKAKVWIQKAEYEHYFAGARPGADGVLDHLTAIVKLHADGRVKLVDGDAKEIIPGVTVYTGGKHTFESQYVGVKTRGGTMVIASDNVYLYENLEKRVPIAATLDAKSNLAAQDRMRQIASGIKRIIPGHDPEVFTRFPKVAEGIVRLD